MFNTNIFIFSFISQFKNQKIAKMVAIFAGVLFLSLLSQLKIKLWFTPVPITGQTFGVTLLALYYGEKLGGVTFLSYLTLGFLGMPIFANGASGLIIGPTFGYLIGMFIAVILVGLISKKINKNKFSHVLALTYLGSLCTFSCGLFCLSFFVSKNQLLALGLLPFIPGDLLKNLLATMLYLRSNK